jgi:hypothetical protein
MSFLNDKNLKCQILRRHVRDIAIKTFDNGGYVNGVATSHC